MFTFSIFTACVILINKRQRQRVGESVSRTKHAIKAAFWSLLEEKPYSSITVKDIVNRCQVNRNTFYYHFQDIPSLLEQVIKEWMDEIIQSCRSTGSPIDCITAIMDACSSRSAAILHIYRSVHLEDFLNYIDKLALYVIRSYIEAATAALPLRPEEKKLLIRFYKCVFVGTALDWLRTGMRYDLTASARQLSGLLAGSGESAFLNLQFPHPPAS